MSCGRVSCWPSSRAYFQAVPTTPIGLTKLGVISLPTDHAIFKQATFKQPVAYTIAGTGAIESLNLASAVNMCVYQLSFMSGIDHSDRITSTQ
jgi:hypothetical protein